MVQPPISAEVLDVSTLVRLLPYPNPDANKYTRGELTVFAGSAAYPGAACLASASAQRMGAGYVRVVCAPETLPIIHQWRPSLVAASWDKGIDPWLPVLKPGHPSACLVGSGFDGAQDEESSIVFEVMERYDGPLVLDGGAFFALATERGKALAQKRADRQAPLIITPHGGEAARLLKPLEALRGDSSGEGVESLRAPAKSLVGRGDSSASQGGAADSELRRVDPAETPEKPTDKNPLIREAFTLARAYHCAVALKGPDTYISDGASVKVMKRGTAALAKAGTGDVLAGMVAALAAQGLAPMDALCLATTLHADAGRLAAETLTEIAVEPEDVIEALPAVFKRWSSDYALEA